MPHMWDDTADPVYMDLQAYFVENDPSQGGALGHQLNFTPTAGLTTVQPLPTPAPDPSQPPILTGLYRLTIRNPKRLGLSLSMTYEQVEQCLAVGMSMQDNGVFYSPVVIQTVHRLQPPINTGVHASLIWTSNVHEDQLSGTLRGLVSFFCQPASNALAGLHREAVGAYWDALHGTHHRVRYSKLYAVLEKGGCDDGTTRRSGTFDSHVAAATNLTDSGGAYPVAAVRELRRCHNEQKHPDTCDPARIRALTPPLKQVADATLYHRAGWARSAHYSPCPLP